jgi:hypothetical protein
VSFLPDTRRPQIQALAFLRLQLPFTPNTRGMPNGAQVPDFPLQGTLALRLLMSIARARRGEASPTGPASFHSFSFTTVCTEILMKLKALASTALILLAGTALAQAPAPAAGAAAENKPSTSTAASPSSQAKPAQSAQAQAKLPADFATADTNKDGKLNVSEFKVVMPSAMIKDSDNDGYVSQAEAEAAISGLAFTSGNDSDDIDATDYREIVAMMNKGSSTTPSSSSTNRSSTNSSSNSAGAGADNDRD